MFDAGLDTGNSIFLESHVERNLVRGKKSDSIDISCKLIRIARNFCNGIIAIGFEYLDGIEGADAVSLQKDHHIPDRPVFLPTVFNVRKFLFRDSRHFQKILDSLLKDLQGPLMEVFHDFVRGFGTDVLDQS